MEEIPVADLSIRLFEEIIMNQELTDLLDTLSKEIFHEENYNVVPSMERIKATMATVNEYVRKSNLTSQSNQPDNTEANQNDLYDSDFGRITGNQRPQSGR